MDGRGSKPLRRSRDAQAGAEAGTAAFVTKRRARGALLATICRVARAAEGRLARREGAVGTKRSTKRPEPCAR